MASPPCAPIRFSRCLTVRKPKTLYLARGVPPCAPIRFSRCLTVRPPSARRLGKRGFFARRGHLTPVNIRPNHHPNTQLSDLAGVSPGGNPKLISWRVASRHAHLFDLAGVPPRVKGLRKTLFCTKQLIEQVFHFLRPTMRHRGHHLCS